MQRAAMALGGLTILTNAAAFYASSRLPALESKIMDKYVITLPESQLDRYCNKHHVFPGAK